MKPIFSWNIATNGEWKFCIENNECTYLDSISGIETWKKILRDGIGVYAYQLMEGINEGCATRCLLEFHDQNISDTYIDLIAYNDHSISGLKSSGNICLSNCKDDEINQMVLAAVFYQSLFLVLNSRTEIGWLQIKLFCAWQWYNFLKLLWLFVNDLKNNDGQQKIWIKNLEKDMAFAYKYLASMIKDPFYASALVWVGNLGKWNRSTKINSKMKMEATLRERILRSLFLIELDKKNIVIHSVNKPCYAPGIVIDKLEWKKVSLHPAFQKATNNREILRLIQVEMLPQCDFRSAYNMAALLQNKAKEKRFSQKFWPGLLSNAYLMSMCFILWMILILFYDKFFIGVYRLFSNALIPDYLHIIGYFSILTIPIIWVMYHFGSNILAYLSLPRLAGGIIVGYLFFIFQDDPSQLSNLLIPNKTLVSSLFTILILWVFTLTFTFFYIRSDIRPILQDDNLAGRRSVFTVGIALSISAVIGLPAIILTTIFSNPNNLGYCLVSPLGKIDFYQYITYVPLALFAGLITQFIFDDKPVSATVWTIEKP